MLIWRIIFFRVLNRACRQSTFRGGVLRTQIQRGQHLPKQGKRIAKWINVLASTWRKWPNAKCINFSAPKLGQERHFVLRVNCHKVSLYKFCSSLSCDGHRLWVVKICNTCLRELRFPPFRTRILLVNMLSDDVIDRESKCCQMVKLFIHSFSIHWKRNVWVRQGYFSLRYVRKWNHKVIEWTLEVIFL